VLYPSCHVSCRLPVCQCLDCLVVNVSVCSLALCQTVSRACLAPCPAMLARQPPEPHRAPQSPQAGRQAGTITLYPCPYLCPCPFTFTPYPLTPYPLTPLLFALCPYPLPFTLTHSSSPLSFTPLLYPLPYIQPPPPCHTMGARGAHRVRIPACTPYTYYMYTTLATSSLMSTLLSTLFLCCTIFVLHIALHYSIL
jgi:hypothetical protein